MQIKKSTELEPLKKTLKVIIENEPAIDVGGVAREYFMLLTKEVFDPTLGMFNFNKDNNLYWFNGMTYEPNINFELIGLIMGLCFYNNYTCDMPLVPACYKILLDKELDM